MSNKTKTSVRGLRRRVESVERVRPKARRAALADRMRFATREALREAPRDTNRFVRALAMAANKAGVGPFRVPRVKGTKRFAEYLAALDRQIDDRKVSIENLRRLHEKLVNRGRSKSEARKVELKIRTLERRNERVIQARADFIASKGTALVFNALRNTTGRRAASVRLKVYGGTGRMYDAGHMSVCELHNLEPHASIVGRLVMSRALKKAKGVKRLSKKMRSELNAAWKKART